MKNGLLKVGTFLIPKRVLIETIAFLRHVGGKGFEGFVLWTAKFEDAGRTIRFIRALVPEQRAMMTANGLLVTVEGAALFDVNKIAHENNEVLAAQVHSHPTDAYHSETDDAFPLVTLVGALSIVVPNFAAGQPGDFEGWAWYRLSKKGRWLPLKKDVLVSVV